MEMSLRSYLDIEFHPVFELDKIKHRKPTMWRYREAIPTGDDADIISFEEGFTPLTEIDIQGRRIIMKQDHLFPIGSYKDKGAAVLISEVKELRVRRVVEDSSGNAGCAIAAYGAKAEVECKIFVPESASPGKLAQIQLYGANLNRIPMRS